MNHWLRYSLATATCLIGGAVLAFAVAIPYVLFVQPDLETSADLTLPHYLRATFVFVLVFVAIYLSSFLLPPAQRRQSSVISGGFLLISFVVIAISLPGSAPFSSLASAMLLDALPVIAAVVFAALLHAPKVA